MPEMPKGRRGAVGGHRLALGESEAWRRCPRCWLPYAAPVLGQPNMRRCLFCGKSFASQERWDPPDELCVFRQVRDGNPPRFLWLRDVGRPGAAPPSTDPGPATGDPSTERKE